MSEAIVAFHAERSLDSMYVHPIDFIATRDELIADIAAAGGYDALSSAAQFVACAWGVQDDRDTVAAAMLTEAKKAWQVLETQYLEAKTQVASQSEAVATALSQYQAALVKLDEATDPDLLSARDAAQTAVTAAQSAYDTAEASRVTAAQVLSDADSKLSTAQAAVSSDTHTLAEWTALVATTQTQLDADPDNTTLQGELAAYQAGLTAHQALVAIQDSALSVRTAAHVDYQAAQTAASAAQTTLQAATQTLTQAQQAIDNIYAAVNLDTLLQQAEAKLSDLMLVREVASTELAADPDNVTLQAAYDAANTAYQAQVAEEKSAQAAYDYRQAMRTAKQVVTNRHSAHTVAQQQLTASQATLATSLAARDAAARTDAEWLTQAQTLTQKWSDWYHTNMMKGRARRSRNAMVLLFQRLGPDQVRTLQATTTLPQLHTNYVETGLKGVQAGQSREGLFDFLYSQTGTTFEGAGLLETGLVPTGAGDSLAQLRDDMVQWLTHGVAA